jgi:hypothetical protein
MQGVLASSAMGAFGTALVAPVTVKVSMTLDEGGIEFGGRFRCRPLKGVPASPCDATGRVASLDGFRQMRHPFGIGDEYFFRILAPPGVFQVRCDMTVDPTFTLGACIGSLTGTYSCKDGVRTPDHGTFGLLMTDCGTCKPGG